MLVEGGEHGLIIQPSANLSSAVLGSVSLWGQGRSHNLNVPGAYIRRSRAFRRILPAKALTPERRNSPQRETLSVLAED